MRLFLLPISTRNNLIYAQRLNKQLTSDATLVEKLSTRANTLWLRWESKESGVQKRITVWGNRLFARIPYQEWGLKSVPPLSARRNEDEIGAAKVEVVFPERIVKAAQVPDILKGLATERLAFHRQRLVWSVLGMPLTIPFAIIPVVPNLPFMYLVFRAYSHWKAFSGAKHITYLLQNGLLENKPSPLLQRIYDAGEASEALAKAVEDAIPESAGLNERATAFEKAVEKGSVSKKTEDPSDEQALLASEGTGRLVSLCYDLLPVEVEISRAVEQVKSQFLAEEGRASSEKLGDEKEKKQ